VALPQAPPGEIADRGVLGQLGLWTAVDADHPSLDDTHALDGWAGDAYVSVRGDKGDCFLDEVRFVDDGARSVGETFLKRWTDRTGVTMTEDSGSQLRLEHCRS
jgi:hypothetical protein